MHLFIFCILIKHLCFFLSYSCGIFLLRLHDNRRTTDLRKNFLISNLLKAPPVDKYQKIILKTHGRSLFPVVK